MSSNRSFSFIDIALTEFDQALRTLAGDAHPAKSETPAVKHTNAEFKDNKLKKHIAGLMRINHCGEVCAQALYQGQALGSKDKKVQKAMKSAADEEIDHLVWCEKHLSELTSHTSITNPAWYALSFILGYAASKAGDEWSLGFVVETEKQVCKHLESHLKQIPEEYAATRAILEQMKIDEEKHGHMASKQGARNIPKAIASLMALSSKLMTHSTYHF